MKSKFIKKFRSKYLDDREEFKEDVKNIEKMIDKKVMKTLYKEMNLETLLEKLIINFNNKNDTVLMRNKIISHGYRVYKNAFRIVANLEIKDKIFLTDKEKNILTFACMTHDIGKLYSDKHHNFYSVVIIDYILSKDKSISKDTLNSILEVIYFHSDKGKRKDKISLLAKILRDADLFDENCGESLFILLISRLKNNNKDLNKIDYTTSKKLLNEKTNYIYTEKTKRKINIKSNVKLYSKLLQEASVNFYRIVQPFEDEQSDLNKPYEYNCITINL